MTVTINASALSIIQLDVDNAIFPYTATPFTFTGLPGPASLIDFHGAGASLSFTINADGSVSDISAPAAAAFDSSTDTLTVTGVTVTINASALSIIQLDVDNAIFPYTATPFTFTGLPGPASLIDFHGASASLSFTINADGSVSNISAPAAATFNSNTDTLTVNGISFTVDAAALSSDASLLVDGAASFAHGDSFNVLPGPQVLIDDNTGNSVPFNVDGSGTVSLAQAQQGVLAVSGPNNNTLQVNGVSVTVDATALSTDASLVIDNEAAFTHGDPATFTVLPGAQFLVDDRTGNSVPFQVDDSGTVSIAQAQQGILAVVNNTLEVNGVSYTVDATALSSDASLEVDGEAVFTHGDPATFTVLPGAQFLYDSHTGNSIPFQVDNSGTISIAQAQQGVLAVTGPGNNTLQVNGVSFTVDATALSTDATLLVDGAVAFTNGDPATFTFLPGAQFLVDDQTGNSVPFSVDDTGAVSIAPAQQGVLAVSGPSNNTLKVNGVTFTVNASALSTDATLLVDNALSFANGDTFTVLPGSLFLTDDHTGNSVPFNVDDTGAVSIAPAQQGVLAVTGAGNNTLVVNGVTVTIDATALKGSVALLDVDNEVFDKPAAPFTFTGLPGAVALNDYYSSGAGVNFTVDPDATVSFASSLNGVLSTSPDDKTLIVHGVSLTVSNASSVANLAVNTNFLVPSGESLTFVGLPGVQSLQDSAGLGTPIDFTLNADGSVSGISEPAAATFNSGTDTLTVTGVTLNIDATQVSGQVSEYAVIGVGDFSTAQVQSMMVLPGTVNIDIGPDQFSFTISTADQIELQSPDSRLSVSNENTLTISAL